jgi:tetratricopeptide (TPR) repeat protein
MYWSGLYTPGVPLGLEVLAHAKARGALRAEAEAAVLVGIMRAWGKRGSPEAAQAAEALLDAARLAERAGADELRAEALTERVRLWNESPTLAELEARIRDAEAALDRAGRPADLTTRFFDRSSGVLIKYGFGAEAEALAARGLKELTPQRGPESLAVADLLGNLAGAKFIAGKGEEGLALARRALAIFEKQRAFERGGYIEQLADFTVMAFVQRHYDEALALVQQEIALRTHASDPSDRAPAVLAHAYDMEGFLFEHGGRCAEALSDFRRVSEALTPLVVLGKPGPSETAALDLADALIGEADCALRSSDLEQATKALDRAGAIGLDPTVAHELTYYRAEALWRSGAKSKARQAMSRALDLWNKDSSDERVSEAGIRSWLAAHR